MLEIRTYKLVPGGRDTFDRIFREGALPMLQRFGIRVVGFGPSLADENSYCLLRMFASVSRREEQLDSFYGSSEWKENYGEAVLALIDSYHTVVIHPTASMGNEFTSVAPTDPVP